MKKAAVLAWPGTFVLALSLVSYSTSSFAIGTAEERAACTPDVFRLCSSEIPNVDKIIGCMKAKKSQLSPKCKAVFNAPQKPTTTASAKTRSMATTESEWCDFKGVSHEPSQQDWVKWCGGAARLK
jgi:hypothetical protein